MSIIPRREIEEILEIMIREPSLRSVFVEGKFDKDLLERHFEINDIATSTSVYCIDTVEIPNDLVSSLKLPLESNKYRVIALANQISLSEEKSPGRAVCIVDADCDRVLENISSYPTLLYTDFTSMEMYCLGNSELAGIFKFSMNMEVEHAEKFLDFAHSILPAIFCIRCIVEELSLKIPSGFPDLSVGFIKAS